MKQCSKCELSKELGEFYNRKSGLRVGEYYEKCKECYKRRGRNYYSWNRVRQLELAKLRKLRYIGERKKFLEEIKKQPCFDCKVSYPPWVMDFDHRNSLEKVANVSKLAFRTIATFDIITREIKKCDLVCSNCHRQRTYERLHKQK